MSSTSWKTSSSSDAAAAAAGPTEPTDLGRAGEPRAGSGARVAKGGGRHTEKAEPAAAARVGERCLGGWGALCGDSARTTWE